MYQLGEASRYQARYGVTGLIRYVHSAFAIDCDTLRQLELLGAIAEPAKNGQQSSRLVVLINTTIAAIDDGDDAEFVYGNVNEAGLIELQ